MIFRYFSLIIFVIFCIVFSCNDTPTSTNKQDTEKPTVSILYPVNNSEFPEDTVLTIIADASDNMLVKKVEFYINGELVYSDSTASYRFQWNANGNAGNHTIKAKAYDTSNNMGESQVVVIKINAVVTNTPPNALFTFSPSGGNTSTSFQFDASISSDAEDSFVQLRFNWDFNNDGVWEINNSTNYNPSYQFVSDGIKTVRLKVTDNGGLFTDTTGTLIVYLTGIVTDFDGNIYQTVKLGSQWWMAENLKVTHFRNGEAITKVTHPQTWASLSTGAYCNYLNDDNNVSIYGSLYNWYAVNDNRGIAPDGWHIPTDNEWNTLEMYLGLTWSQANEIGNRGNLGIGEKMKSGPPHWIGSLNTANSSGFTALPGGYRRDNGYWDNIGHSGAWWVSTAYNDSLAWYHFLIDIYTLVGRNYSDKHFGNSIRCVKD